MNVGQSWIDSDWFAEWLRLARHEKENLPNADTAGGAEQARGENQKAVQCLAIDARQIQSAKGLGERLGVASVGATFSASAM